MRGGEVFGFNGKENDKETGYQDYGFRLYDRKIARFITPDPLTKKFPMLTPYQFASNTPIQAIDLDGLEAVKAFHFYNQKGELTQTVKYVDVESSFSKEKTEGFAVDANGNVEYIYSQEKENDFGTYVSLLWEHKNKGGINFTWEDGKGKEKRQGYGNNIKMTEIDDIMSAFGQSKSVVNKASKNIAEGLGYLFSMFETGQNGADAINKLLGRKTQEKKGELSKDGKTFYETGTKGDTLMEYDVDEKWDGSKELGEGKPHKK